MGAGTYLPSLLSSCLLGAALAVLHTPALFLSRYSGLKAAALLSLPLGPCCLHRAAVGAPRVCPPAPVRVPRWWLGPAG